MEQRVASGGNYFERVACQYNDVIYKALFYTLVLLFNSHSL
jgi:hypothetical protein